MMPRIGPVQEIEQTEEFGIGLVRAIGRPRQGWPPERPVRKGRTDAPTGSIFWGVMTSTRMLLRIFHLATLLFALTLTAILSVPNALLHMPATSLVPASREREHDVLAQLRFLQDAIDRGAAHRMQHIYPEGYFFQHVLTGLAWCDLARESADSSLRREAVTAARQALASLESEDGTDIFPEEVAPKYGVFWAAWTNLLRGRILALEGWRTDSTLFGKWRAGLDGIAAAYEGKENPYQPSYVGMAWSGDNVMAMLALASHDRLLDTARYASATRHWVERVRATLDPATGMPPFELEHPGGAVVKTPRGSSQTLFAWALTAIDTAFAREQYLRLRDHFYATRLGLPVVLEFQPDAPEPGDYDSGPVVWGVGSSATIVSLATARRFGDTAFAQGLETTIRFFGLPMRWNGRTAFALGRMPVGDAWIAWARTSTPAPGIQIPQWAVSSRRTWTIHALSVLVLLSAWSFWFVVRRWTKSVQVPVA